MHPFRKIFYLLVLILFLLISIPIGILLLIFDISLTAEDNVPNWVNALPLQAETTHAATPTEVRAGRTEVLA